MPEPERLGVELVNRYHAVKSAGLDSDSSIQKSPMAIFRP